MPDRMGVTLETIIQILLKRSFSVSYSQAGSQDGSFQFRFLSVQSENLILFDENVAKVVVKLDPVRLVSEV